MFTNDIDEEFDQVDNTNTVNATGKLVMKFNKTLGLLAAALITASGVNVSQALELVIQGQTLVPQSTNDTCIFMAGE